MPVLVATPADLSDEQLAAIASAGTNLALSPRVTRGCLTGLTPPLRYRQIRLMRRSQSYSDAGSVLRAPPRPC